MSLTFVQPAPQSTSIIPEAVVNVYQGFNALTRIFRKGCEGIEQVNDVALLYMHDAIKAQHDELTNRAQATLINP